MSIKQVLVVRKDLNMRRGKECAQCAHASVGVITETMWGNGQNLDILVSLWLDTGQAKIVVYVNSEQELLDLHQRAKDAKLHTYLVTDAGRTEFNGVPTNTVLAIGPANSDDFVGLTDQLPLY